MPIAEQRPAAPQPQPDAPRSKWAFIVVVGLLLLIAVLVIQLYLDEPGRGTIPTQNGAVRELVGPKR